MRPGRWPRDLLATLVLALAALAVALLSAPHWARAALLLPLVFALPGYAVSYAAMPSRGIPAVERAVYAVALSIAVCVLSAVLIQLFTPLDRRTWAILLSSITALATAVALARAHRPSLRLHLRQPIAPITAGRVLAIIAAVAIATGAIAIASAGARRDRAGTHFSELWVLPAKPLRPGQQAALIGVANHEGIPVSYVLQMNHGPLFRSQPIRLAAGRTWQTRLAARGISRSDPLDVTLLRAGRVYRRVSLKSGLDT